MTLASLPSWPWISWRYVRYFNSEIHSGGLFKYYAAVICVQLKNAQVLAMYVRLLYFVTLQFHFPLNDFLNETLQTITYMYSRQLNRGVDEWGIISHGGFFTTLNLVCQRILNVKYSYACFTFTLKMTGATGPNISSYWYRILLNSCSCIRPPELNAFPIWKVQVYM